MPTLIKKPSIHINKETNIISVRVTDNKVSESDSRGNCIIDFDEKGNVCRIEILPFEINA